MHKVVPRGTQPKNICQCGVCGMKERTSLQIPDGWREVKLSVLLGKDKKEPKWDSVFEGNVCRSCSSGIAFNKKERFWVNSAFKRIWERLFDNRKNRL